MAASIENKVLTENPLLDEIVYNCRQLCTETVLKDQDEADKHETLETLQDGDTLVDIAQGRVTFGRFYYSEELLRKIPSISPENAKKWAIDNKLIPQELRDQCLQVAQDEFVNNYIEYNNYYRCIHGEPNYDATGKWQGLWIDTRTILPGSSTLPDINTYQVNKHYQLIHELDPSYIEILNNDGVYEEIYNDSTLLSSLSVSKSDIRYLFHMGNRSISYYDARSAGRFDLLYCPESDSSDLTKRYKELLEANKIMMLYNHYSLAYNFQSPYYDKFMMIFIVIQTIIDMIIELPEYIIRKDVFDSRTCQYIFESAGVEYFPEIPLKYQMALVKNLNKLIKFKSTDTCLVDICSIFGCDNIQIFKHYILRDRNVTNPVDQEYLNHSKTVVTEDGIKQVPDNDKNYDLKFVKVPIGESYDNYIRNESNIVDYDSMTYADPYWTGDKTYDEVKSAIKDTDFTLLRSKYYSTEAVIDIAQRSFTIIYFMNILLYNKIDKSQLKVLLPNVNTKNKFELVDTIITLFALGYVYWGVEDTIMNTHTKILSILGFNFEADMQKIQEYLANKYPDGTVKWDELGVDGFMFPTDGKILTYKQLMEIYTTNKDIYDHVTYQICHPENRDLYYAYRYLYDSLFVMKGHMDYFGKPEDTNKKLPTKLDGGKAKDTVYAGTIDGGYSFDDEEYVIDAGYYSESDSNMVIAYPTYTEFLRYKAPELYSFIMRIKNISDAGKRQTACVNAIQSIVSYLKDYIDTDIVNIEELLSGLPSISLDFIVDYINKVIEFFQSFKIFTHNTSVRYLFTDKFNNSVIIVDWMLLQFLFEKSETVFINDLPKKFTSKINPKEAEWILDKVWLDVNTWVKKNFSDYMDNEKYKDFCSAIRDAQEHFATYQVFDNFDEQISDALIQLLVSINLEDHVEIRDDISEILFILSKEEHIDEQITDLIYDILVHVVLKDVYFLKEDISRFTQLSGDSFMRYTDRIGKSRVYKTLNDSKYELIDDYFIVITNE